MMRTLRALTLALAPALALTAPAAPAAAATTDVRVVSWNVDFTDSRQQVTNGWNRIAGKGDVFLLQETKNVDLREVVDTREFGVVQRGGHGSAERGSSIVYRKSKLMKTWDGLVFGVAGSACTDSMQTRYIHRVNLRVLGTGRGVAFGSAHLPPKDCGAASRTTMADNIVAMARATSKPQVIGGDWNLDLTTQNPFAIPSRTGLSKSAKPASAGSRIDGFFSSGGLQPSRTATVLDPTASDHRPIRITISVRS